MLLARPTPNYKLFLLSLLFLLLLSACGGADSDDSSIANFAGQVENSDAFVGMLVAGNQVLAYLCNSNSISEWFRGEVSPGEVLNLASAGGAQLQASLTETAAQGTVTLADGSSLSFTAAAVTGAAGLYRDEITIEGVPYVAGWIVLPDGEQRGALTLTIDEAKSPTTSQAADTSGGKNLPFPVLPAPRLTPEQQEELEEIRESLLTVLSEQKQ